MPVSNHSPGASFIERFYPWWYLSIAVGFLLLAIRQTLVGGRWPGIVVRVVIAIGFALLAYQTVRSRKGR